MLTVAGVALADSLRGNRDDLAAAGPVARLRGADVPVEGALPGRLRYRTEQGCTLETLDFDDLSLQATDNRPGCGGPLPVDSGSREPRIVVVDRPGRREVVVDGRSILTELDLTMGFDPVPSGPVHPLGADTSRDGLLAVVASAAPRDVVDVLSELGIDLRDTGDLAEAREALGLNGPFGAMALSGGGSLGMVRLQLWRRGELERSLPLPSLDYVGARFLFGEVVRFSPDGTELAVGRRVAGGDLMLVDVRTGRPLLPPTPQEGFAWSPDGAWFALASGGEVSVFGTLRSDPVYRLPLDATGLAWVR